MQVYKVLAGLDFSGKIFEAKAQTALGNELINKYRTFVVANPTTCATVNSFLREARGLSYDSGIQALVESLAETINDNKYGWAIASVCENIANGKSGRGNYLQLRALEQVQPMLEMKEDEIVSYIKSGALKNVMYVEAFRNIAKSIYREQPIVEYSEDFKVVHPISLVEQVEDSYYFHAAGRIFRTNTEGIFEVDRRDVSNDFLTVASLLESGTLKYADDTLSMEIANRIYKVYEDNGEVKASITINDKVSVYTIDQLRENNNYFVMSAPANLKAQRAVLLESFAKVFENFNKIAILNNVSIISNQNDRFILIENNGNAYAKLLQSNHSQLWEVKNDIAKVCESVKKFTRLDVSKLYTESINNAVAATKEKEGQQIKENLENEAIEERRQRIALLTEQFKNDPIRLKMLASIAADLNEIK